MLIANHECRFASRSAVISRRERARVDQTAKEVSQEEPDTYYPARPATQGRITAPYKTQHPPMRARVVLFRALGRLLAAARWDQFEGGLRVEFIPTLLYRVCQWTS